METTVNKQNQKVISKWIPLGTDFKYLYCDNCKSISDTPWIHCLVCYAKMSNGKVDTNGVFLVKSKY